jgi:alpha-L-rhamnosidase
LGDWCPPGGNAMIDCPVALSSTAFHYLDLTILTKTAQLLGYTNDAMHYAVRMGKVKEQFNAQFFDTEINSYGGQTANSMAIQLGLVPDGKTPEIVRTLVRDINTKNNGFMQTGIFGLGRIFPSLAENGAEDLAFSMFTKTGEHSFAYMWDKYNATTLWEVLPVNDVMNAETLNGRSHSHPMNAGYDEWFYRGIAGINPDEKAPGFKHIVFRPYFTSKLKHAEATYESPYGTIVSNWKWEGEVFAWNIEIPANSGADIFIPKLFNNQRITINGKEEELRLSENNSTPGFYVYKSVGSGIYNLMVTNNDISK